MRTKSVTVNGKTVIVNEKRIGELKALGNKYKDEFDNLIKVNTADDLTKAVSDIFYTKIPELFPVLTADDIDNAYPSELEELAGAFIDVNFTGIKKVGAPLLQTILAGLNKLQPSS